MCSLKTDGSRISSRSTTGIMIYNSNIYRKFQADKNRQADKPKPPTSR
jgi:hypothetical protein